MTPAACPTQSPGPFRFLVPPSNNPERAEGGTPLPARFAGREAVPPTAGSPERRGTLGTTRHVLHRQGGRPASVRLLGHRLPPLLRGEARPPPRGQQAR